VERGISLNFPKKSDRVKAFPDSHRPAGLGKIPRMGKVTKARFNGLGIHQIGDLLRLTDSLLEEKFGKCRQGAERALGLGSKGTNFDLLILWNSG